MIAAPVPAMLNPMSLQGTANSAEYVSTNLLVLGHSTGRNSRTGERCHYRLCQRRGSTAGVFGGLTPRGMAFRFPQPLDAMKAIGYSS